MRMLSLLLEEEEEEEDSSLEDEEPNCASLTLQVTGSAALLLSTIATVSSANSTERST